MRVRKTTLQRVLEKTGGNYDVPLILAGHFAGFADQTTRNRLSAGTPPFFYLTAVCWTLEEFVAVVRQFVGG